MLSEPGVVVKAFSQKVTNSSSLQIDSFAWVRRKLFHRNKRKGKQKNTIIKVKKHSLTFKWIIRSVITAPNVIKLKNSISGRSKWAEYTVDCGLHCDSKH